jgi:hypothetical protein
MLNGYRLTAFLWVIYASNSGLKVYSTLINFHLMKVSQFATAYLEMRKLHKGSLMER